MVVGGTGEPALTALDFTRVGDPVADAALDRLQVGGRVDRDLLAAVEEAALHDDACARLADEARSVPGWVDPAAMGPGREMFLRHAPVAIAVFVLGSLVEVYGPPDIARVLAATGRLERDVVRRLYETAQLVYDVLEHDGLRVGGPGWRSALRVRLLHAMVRRHVRRAGRDSRMPIHQHEMALTLGLHSTAIVRRLERFGAHVTRDEAASYQHLWRYVGHLLGIDARLLDPTVEEEERRLRGLRARLHAPGADARRLTRALLQGLDRRPPFHLPLPVLAAISRRALGASMADAFDVPRSATGSVATRAAAGPIALLSWGTAGASFRFRAAEAGRRYFAGVLAAGLAGAEVDYAFARR